MKAMFEALPLRQRLIAMSLAACVVMLVTSMAAQIYFRVGDERDAHVERMRAIAAVAATASVDAVSLDDELLGTQVLVALGAESSFVSGAILARDGTRIAFWRRAVAGPPVRAVDTDVATVRRWVAAGREVVHEPVAGEVVVLMPVLVDRELGGFLLLQARRGGLGGILALQLATEALAMLAALLLAGVMAARFSSSITKPVGELLGVMQRVVADQDYSLRVAHGGSDELGRVVDGFNQMLARVQQTDDQLRLERAALEEQVGERTRELQVALTVTRRSMAEAQEARRVAERASVAKSEFLARMSHEIRTPMNGVLGMTELLMDTALDSRQRRFAETIQTSADALLAIINDVLDFSKVEVGKLRLEAGEFSLVDLVEEVVDLFAKRAHDKHIELMLDWQAGTPDRVVGDRLRLRQMVSNLVANGIKFTDRGHVLVRVRDASGSGDNVAGRRRIEIDVADTGIGIRAENQAAVFEAFVQEDGSISRRFGGSGLGLAITRQLADLMGGEVRLRSTVGVGSTFTIAAPLLPGQAREAVPGAIAQIRAGLHALIVDDYQVNREILEQQMNAMGFVARSVADAKAALRVLEAEGLRPDVMVIDFQLPDTNGLELVARLRQLAACAEVPAVLLSSLAVDICTDQTSSLRPFASLSKPVRRVVLERTIASLLSGADRSDLATLSRAPAVDVASISLSGSRVLLVEDNLVNRQLAIEILGSFGCELATATNGDEALFHLSMASFDIVLMDCQMPVMDGLSATRLWRARESERGARRTPIIGLTANALQGDRDACIDAGMDDYLTKPFSIAQLRDLLIRMLKPEWCGAAAVPDPPSMAAAPAPSINVSVEARLEPAALAAIAELDPGGKKGLVKRIVTLFVDDSARLLAALDSALDGGDADAARRSAHTLKSTAANVGGMALAQAAGAAEHSIKQGDSAGARAALPRLRVLRDATLAALAEQQRGAAA